MGMLASWKCLGERISVHVARKRNYSVYSMVRRCSCIFSGQSSFGVKKSESCDAAHIQYIMLVICEGVEGGRQVAHVPG